MSGTRRKTVLIAATVLALSVFCWPLSEVHARAGGGQNYSGSGGSSSHSSHSSSSSSHRHTGSSGGASAPMDPAAAFKGFIGLVFIVVIYLLIKRISRGRAGFDPGMFSQAGSSGGAAGGFGRATVAANLSSALVEFKAQDPNFSEQQFEDLASTAFFKIQDAWSRRDMSSARQFVSPTLIQRFQSQLEQLKRDGQINKMDNLAVGSVELAEVAHDGGHDYITVKIEASAADYTVEEKSGRIVSGSKESTPFTEYWTFVRSGQVKTPKGTPELVSRQCPNCGAPLQVNAVGKCGYCGSDVTSGQYNWVLSEITQASVWRPRAQAVKPPNISPLGSGRYVLGIVQCPKCGANVQDVAGITTEKCWRCGAVVETKQ